MLSLHQGSLLLSYLTPSANYSCGTRSSRKRHSLTATPPDDPKKKTKRRKKTDKAVRPSTSDGPDEFDQDEWKACNQNPPGKSNAKSIRSRNISAEMDDTPKTDSEKLSQCLANLNNPNDVLGDEESSLCLGPTDSKFRKNVAGVFCLLEKMVQSRILDTLSNGGSNMTNEPAAMYVCGVPGTGKTSGIQFCCNKVVNNFTEGSWSGEKIEPVVVEINAARLTSCGPENAKRQLIQTIWSCCKKKGNGDEKTLMKSMQTRRSNGKKLFVILVLDEIDQLVSNKSTGNTANGGEKLLRELSFWSKNSDYRFALIGIGNSINNSKQRRVKQFVKVRQYCVSRTSQLA